MIREIAQLLGPAIRTGSLYQIQRMNREPGRKDYTGVLKSDPNLIGVIVSQPTGKCIGIIDPQGQIKHCDGKDAISPYTVIMKSSVIDRKPGLLKSFKSFKPSQPEKVLGQCVNERGTTVAELVRKDRKNTIRPAVKSTAPVLAVVVPIPDKAPLVAPSPSIDNI